MSSVRPCVCSFILAVVSAISVICVDGYSVQFRFSASLALTLGCYLLNKLIFINLLGFQVKRLKLKVICMSYVLSYLLLLIIYHLFHRLVFNY